MAEKDRHESDEAQECLQNITESLGFSVEGMLQTIWRADAPWSQPGRALTSPADRNFSDLLHPQEIVSLRLLHRPQPSHLIH
jgi:hypothetical protein